MSTGKVEPSEAGEMEDLLKKNLLQLSEAEELVCKVLQLSANTCEELERLPFSDSEKLQGLSTEVIYALQNVRSNIVSSLDSIKPMEAQQTTTDSTKEANAILSALEKFK